MFLQYPLRKLLSALFALWCGCALTGAIASPTVRVQSVVPTLSRAAPGTPGLVTRQVLTAAELKAEQPVHFAIRMRNLDELTARIEHGEILSLEEMTARYFPRSETWRRVAKWAATQGFNVDREDLTRLHVFARASTERVQTALQMKFARVVGTDGAEYTSAISAPALPAEFQDDIVAVLELQPHLRPLPVQAVPQLPDRYVLPQAFAVHYNATNLGFDGQGQTIAIMGANRVNPDDLTTFWQTSGLPTTLAQFRSVDLSNNPVPGDSSRSGEETMDVEWASAMAPRANIVLLTNLSIGLVASWIASEHAEGRPVHSLSCSFGSPESVGIGFDAARNAENQSYATLAALGVSMFIASGDDGSTQLITNGVLTVRGYNPSGTTSALYPASSPFVTGVGGTTVAFTQQDGVGAVLPIREGAWTLPNIPPPSLVGLRAGGGGVSAFFARPAWQTGPGVPAGTMRCVPDVAAMASCNFAPYMHFRGMKFPAGGTSVSAPMWAGFAAVINQARAAAGLPPLGLLGPRIYPLNGTNAFNQMTTGSQSGGDGFSSTATNGAYMVGPNYNLVAGLGSPNVGRLIAGLLTEPTAAPAITVQPKSLVVDAGQSVSFSVVASGYPAPTFQWYFNNAVFSGATGSTLSFSNARTIDSGEYKVVATNSAGTATSVVATLRVDALQPPVPPAPAPAAGGGGGGGGGAPSLWFAGVLGLLGFVRMWSSAIRGRHGRCTR